jgi:probable F420-dependent oxidoreductase
MHGSGVVSDRERWWIRVGRLRGVKIRIGLGVPAGGLDLAPFVDEAERLKFDSLWVTERVNAPTLDPIVAMTFIAARTARMKLGASVMVLPGRNPVLLAKALASIDRVSDGRLLPAFGLGVANAAEHQAFGVARGDRARLFDEALPLMRRLWSEDHVTHHGARFTLDDVTVLPKPVQAHLDVWLGGASRAELARCGRLGDGWLPSFATPDAVRAGIDVVNEAAAAADRSIDPEHFGVLIPYVEGPIPPPLADVVRTRSPDARPEDAIATSKAQLRERIEAYIDVGASKFVLFPYAGVDDWTDELEALADDLLPMQT